MKYEKRLGETLPSLLQFISLYIHLLKGLEEAVNVEVQLSH